MIMNHRGLEPQNKIFSYCCLAISLFIITILNCGCTNTNAPVVSHETATLEFLQNYLLSDFIQTNDCIACEDGSFIVIGENKYLNTSNGYMMKVDATGNELWRNAFNADRSGTFISIVRTFD